MMHQLQQPVIVQDKDSRDLEHPHPRHHHHPERAASAAITTTTHQQHQQHQHYRSSHNSFHHPMAFESSPSDPETSSLLTHPPSLSDILDNLPSAVKSSLGPLNTIRRSVSIRSWASYFYEISSNTMGVAASHEGATAARSTTVVSRTTSTTAVEMQQHSNRGEKRVAAAHSQAQAQRRMAEPPHYEEVDQSFGINRFCGLQGQLLVNNSLSDGRPSSLQGHAAAGRIDRKAYVQGVAWLVHGLPDDLDKHERTELIRAMPPSLWEEAHRTPTSRQPGAPPYPSSSSTSSSSSSSSTTTPPPPSGYGYYYLGASSGAMGEAGWTLAQRLLHAAWLQLLVPLHMLWAYVLVLLGRAGRLEREYKVTEQVVKHSGELGYGVGKGGVRLSGVIYNHGGARVGHLVTNVVAYTADGLVKGISDGIREARSERHRCCGGGGGSGEECGGGGGGGGGGGD
ncbi:hypothetical protein KVR01_003919 [Diaporthe batatas]|uniref:uncharacterized protein n=1 Tax=Diaporthe batatas TaxID=748121 RepID=UPI001D039E9F|nr:uncharacterized protein KVR01_003919 [Diaporthe batatas]KAG8168230.1 hypothetical protein KVR01_003919 [Diaporthe batatas]